MQSTKLELQEMRIRWKQNDLMEVQGVVRHLREQLYLYESKMGTLKDDLLVMKRDIALERTNSM